MLDLREHAETADLASFQAANPDFDIVSADLLSEAALDRVNWVGVDRVETLSRLRRWQRLLRIEPDPAVAAWLLDRGIDSAQRLTSISRTQFVRTLGDEVAGGATRAARIYDSATAVKSRAMHLAANVHALVASRSFQAMAVNHIPSDLTDYFQTLSSYSEMFGSLDYCACNECSSIYGPAAYLVDLLRIIDLAITGPNSTRPDAATVAAARAKFDQGGLDALSDAEQLLLFQQNIPPGLRLDERRPDLGRLALTCGNTLDLVPYLQIVNAVLHQTVSTVLAAGGRLQNGDVYLTLANMQYPFNLPFNLPLARVRRYVAAGQSSLGAIYSAFAPGSALPPEAARERIGLTAEAMANLAPVADDQRAAAVSANYGLPVTATNLAGLDRLDGFIAQTGLLLTDVQAILGQNLSAKERFDASGLYQVSTGKGTRLALSQDGDQVSGSYTTANATGGSVHGVLRDRLLRGVWQEGSGNAAAGGSLALQFAAGGSGFSGVWTDGPGGTGTQQPWNGTRDASTPSTAGIIPHSLFINRSLGPRQFLQIVENNADPNAPYSQIQGQSLATLDATNRFVRLARTLGWTWADLNWVLTSLAAPVVDGAGNISSPVELDGATLVEIAKVKRLVDEFGLPLELATALWFDLRTIGCGDGDASIAPFDVVFNNASLLAQYPARGVYHPRVAAGPTSYPNPLYGRTPLPWMPGGLQNGDGAAATVVAGIPAPSDEVAVVAVAAFGAGSAIDLTVPNLTLLYRHTQLARHLGLRAAAYVRLLALLGHANAGRISATLDRDQALAVIEAARWIGASGLRVEDVDYAVNGAGGGTAQGYDPSAIPAFLAALAQTLKPELLGPGAFVSPLVSAAQSAAIVQALLHQGFVDPAGVIVKDASVAPPDFSTVADFAPDARSPRDDQQAYVVTKLVEQRTQQRARLSSQLATLFGVSSDTLATLWPAAASWLRQPTALESFVVDGWFDAAAADVIVNGALDQAALTKAFAQHGATLPANAQIQPLTVTAWGLTAAASGAARRFRAVSSDLVSVSFFSAPADAGGVGELLFHAAGADVLSGGDLDATRLTGVFAAHGVKLDAPPTVASLVQPRAWSILDPTSAATCYATRPDGGATVHVLAASAAQATVPAPVAAILDLLSRFLVLANGLSLPAPTTALLAQQPRVFGIVDDGRSPLAFTLDAVRLLYRFTQLTAAFHDNTGKLAAYLAAAQQPVGPAAAYAAALCGVTGWDAAQCAFLCGTLFGAGGVCNTVDRVDRLARLFAIAAGLSVDVYLLSGLYDARGMQATAANWPTLGALADRLLQAARTRATAEAWPSVLDDLDSPIAEQRRDALVPLAILELGKRFEDLTTPRNLYEYLLLDVEMSGCAQISVLKEALNAAQLYLQRCRLNLERNVVISSHDLPNVWWEWLLNYRVWEANRMIFLYPENYIDPSLRHTKTQLFQDFENSLLQGPATEEKVDDAFRTYLDGFALLAKLEHVDSYHAVVSDDNLGELDTLFVFSRTDTQPYKFYYANRQRLADCANNTGDVWSEWLPIEISINAPYITPVYAFNKLFILWVELSEKKEPDGSSDPTKRLPITRASIKLSYRNFAGRWVQPQTVVADQVVNVAAGELYGPFSTLLADQDALWWKKVAALRVPPVRYANGVEAAEKLVIYYGPLVDRGFAGGSAPTSPDKSADAVDFVQTVAQGCFVSNQLSGLRLTGKSPLLPALVLDANLDPTALTFDNQYPLMHINVASETSPPTFRPGLIGRSLVAEESYHSLVNEYIAGSSLEPATIYPPQTPLDRSSFVGDGITAETSSRYFDILSTAPNDLIDKATGLVAQGAERVDLTFLSTILASSVAVARAVRERLQWSRFGTPVLFTNTSTRNAAVIPTRNQPGSFLFRNGNETFLVEAATPSGAGFAMTDSALSVSTAVKAVTPEAFVTRDINADTSRRFYTILSKPPNAVIDANGVVDQAAVTRGGAAMLQTLLATDAGRVQQVQSILLSGFGPAEMRYAASGFAPTDSVYSLQFRATRLSTSAMHRLSAALYSGGAGSLLALPMQQLPTNLRLEFDQLGPTDKNVATVASPAPLLVPPASRFGEQVDFNGPYGLYFWELFFHAPMLVAKMLHDNQQFQAAERWYQFIFNPTLPPDPLTAQRFAQVLPENIDPARAGAIYAALSDPKNGWIDPQGTVSAAVLTADTATILTATQTTPVQAQELKNLLVNRYLVKATARYWQFQPFRNRTLETLKDQLQNCAEVAAYQSDPFDPHAIARLRPGAYEKATVMAYIGNLLDWGDQEFTRYTWESITTARMLYSYAYDLLGRRPEDLGRCTEQFPTSFDAILARYHGDPHQIPPFLIDMENALGGGQASGPLLRTAGRPFNDLGGVFCVPENAQLVALWDRVEDRLYKIRNCLNILGERQPLPLFEPPINPADLVRAAALGGDFAGLESSLQPLVPNYRFAIMVERAEEFTETVRSFGAALLAALERRDAEQLSLLRATQEAGILAMVTATKEKAIDDLEAQLTSLQHGLSSAQFRHDYYGQLISDGLNAGEIANYTLMALALNAKYSSVPFYALSIVGYLAVKIFGLADGGFEFGKAVESGAQTLTALAEVLGQSAAIAQLAGEQQRRAEEWDLQRSLAQYEVAQISAQIDANNARIAAAQQDLAINRQEIANARAVQSVLQSNFTNQALYQWMVGRLSGVYFQAFRLARDLALAAQTAYQFELDRDEQFISFSSWDDLRQGLLAGEGQLLELKQLRKSYLDNNGRRLEIEKTISMRQSFPRAFFAFQYGKGANAVGDGPGRLDFVLSEQLFDFDYPGHYGRKIASVSMSLPSVIGPYQDFHATLTQNSNLVVLKPDATAVDYAVYRSSAPNGSSQAPTPPPGSVRENWTPNQSIAVSRGVDDAGLFTLDFRDERYLPFEGTGAVSSWTFSLPPETNRIDFASISDVIVKLRYTARDGGSDFGARVKRLYSQSGDRYADLNAATFSLSRSFSSQWAALFATPPSNGIQTLSFPVARGTVLPNLHGVALHGVIVRLSVADGVAVSSEAGKEFVALQIDGKPMTPVPIGVSNNVGELQPQQAAQFGSGFTGVSWSLVFNTSNAPSDLLTSGALNQTKLLDVSLIVVYSAQPFGPA